jgi:exo-beta-1,3-glucanase (GH17 family)
MSRPVSSPASPSAGATHGKAGGEHPAASLRSGAQPVTGAPGGRWATSSTQVWTADSRDALARDFAATLQRGTHGLCFSPYLEGQQPGDQIGEAQIRARLQIMRPHARWIRSFSCTDGHEQTPRIAHELGLKTLVGAWLGTDADINERELQGVIDVARAGHADIVAVGNEVLLREDMSEDALLACIQRVKDALPGVPVGYVDAYYLFEKHPRITAACDVVMTNCYPFWEGCPREQALAYMQTMVARTRAAAPGKRVLISETGWPDQGSAFHGAVPSREGAMQYFVDTCRWAEEDGIELFYFAAFDEAWKVGAEGDVGAFWGLWDKDGVLKFG